MTNAINTLTSLIGKESAEFFTNYLKNGHTLTVYTLDGEFVIEDKNGSVVDSSFKTFNDTQEAAGRWNVTNAVRHMEQNGEVTELTADEVEDTPEVEESNEVEEMSAIDTAAELVAEGADVNEVVQMITVERGSDIGGKVRDHFLTLKS